MSDYDDIFKLVGTILLIVIILSIIGNVSFRPNVVQYRPVRHHRHHRHHPRHPHHPRGQYVPYWGSV